MIDWKPFLVRWSRELMTTELAARVDPLPESPDWLGFSPASAEEVAALEARLGATLPPSYKSFLLTTDGWRRTNPFIGRVRPAGEVDWFRVENESWADTYSDSGSDLADKEYYRYDEKEGAADHRAGHMKSLLQVSDVDDGVYLLNPEAVTPDGEWEAWFFANWVPGAVRFPSFAHLMLHEYRSFAQSANVGGDGPPLPRLPAPLPNVPRVPARRRRKKRAGAPTLDALLEAMRSPDDAARGRAVRTFFGKLKGRPRATRRPEMVRPLTDLFYAATDPQVRSACVAALTEVAEEGSAPPPLFDALSDPDPGVALHGMYALHYFKDGHALEPLCRFVASGAHPLYKETAISHLGEMGDERAVPTLAGVLLDTRNTFDQSFGSAGIALGRCGPKGFDILVTALGHEDARVRHAAVVGLDVAGDPRAEAHLERMKTDPDPRVRERAKIRTGNLWR